MIEAAPRLKDLCEAVITASKELSSVALALDITEFAEWRSGLPPGGYGAYVPLVGDSISAHIGVISNEEGCQKLTRILMEMDDNENTAEEDVWDAMGEIANIIAGGVKSALTGNSANLKIGLPIVIEGHPALNEKQTQVWTGAELGSVHVDFLLVVSMET
jgi:CheY-specific phosphatase CheX